MIVKSLHILSLGTFVRISTARCLDQGDEINIVTRAEEFSTTHTPKTPHAAADQTAVSVQHFQHVDTSICNNIFKTENLVFRTKKYPDRTCNILSCRQTFKFKLNKERGKIVRYRYNYLKISIMEDSDD